MLQVGLDKLTDPSRHPVLALGREGLEAWLRERDRPALHARQILRWILAARATSFDSMSDLPKPLRHELNDAFQVFGTRVARQQVASDGTTKLLVELPDAQQIECVMIPERDRRTACISTQVGCAMGCVFCASGLRGVERNLESWEILEQLVLARNLLPAAERLTNIVVMGMGEPLANLENLLTALDSTITPQGLGISPRHITISTVGLPAKMRRLADLGKPYHLAVSLHAPTSLLRSQIVPTNDKTGLEEILAAAQYFFERVGRRVTYEYVMLRDVNDRPEHARQLDALLRMQRGAHINLIPFNEVDGLPFSRPSDQGLKAFVDYLRNAGFSVKVRKRKGSDIDAACGQLRRRAELESGASVS